MGDLVLDPGGLGNGISKVIRPSKVTCATYNYGYVT